MKVAFVDLPRQNKIYKKEFDEAVDEIISTASFIEGPKLYEFEEKFAGFCGSKYCVGVNSGTDALLLLLRAYGIGLNDEVITVSFTYIATAMTVTCTGATPVFVDVDKETYTIAPELIEEKITQKTRAIIPVHLYGQSADMDPIVAIAKKHNLVIIEDCAQAHGARYKGQIVPVTGTGAFSFYPGKNLGAFGDSGAIVTNSKDIRDKLLLLRNDGSVEKYVHKIIGYKSRLDTLQAAVLLAKLPHLSSFNKKRREAAEKYNNHLKKIKQIITPKEASYAIHIYHIYAILVLSKRDELQKYLGKHGIKTVIHYPTPVHLQEVYQNLGYQKGDFPVSEMLANNTISLPMFPEIKDEEIEFVCQKIREFYS